MILVAGGTGRLGTALVSRLLDRGLDVRVLTRDPERAAHLGDGVQVVRGDVRDPTTLEPAVAGVSVVVSAVHGFAGPGRVSPASVDRDGNAHLVDAAGSVGADVVLMSLVGAAADSPIDLFRAKHDAETYLRAGPVPWTIIRATSFVELWAELLSKGIVFGRGDNPINFVAVDDVAAVVELAAAEGQYRGWVVEVGGPEDLTLNELVRVVQEITGSPRSARHLPRWFLRLAATFGQQPRVALARDTQDMTFAPPAAQLLGTRQTDVRTALTGTRPS
jgi:uncharacterized protein YbjT (DUF2867 family)